MAALDAKQEAIEKAAKALRYALKTGDNEHHAAMVHREIVSRTDSILSNYPSGTLTKAQKEAICEMLASAILMSSLSSRPPEKWIGRAWKEFCNQGPWQQIASFLQILAVVGAVAGVISTAVVYAPVGVGWLAQSVGTSNPAPVPLTTSKP